MSAELLNWIIRDIDTWSINLWPLLGPMRYLHNQCNILWNLPSRLHAIWKGSHMFWNNQLALSLSIWGQLFLFISTLRWLFPQIYQFSPGPVIFPLFPRSRCLVHAALSMDYWQSWGNKESISCKLGCIDITKYRFHSSTREIDDVFSYTRVSISILRIQMLILVPTRFSICVEFQDVTDFGIIICFSSTIFRYLWLR